MLSFPSVLAVLRITKYVGSGIPAVSASIAFLCSLLASILSICCFANAVLYEFAFDNKSDFSISVRLLYDWLFNNPDTMDEAVCPVIR